MLRLNLSKKAKKFLSNLPFKQANQIARKIGMLMLDPSPQDSKKLVGQAFYRVDSGEYRIIYDFDTEILEVILIGKRNDGEVYKKLKQHLS